MDLANKEMKTITILLTRYSDWFGTFYRTLTGDSYSHASLSVDDTDEVFYSFNYRGFVVEKPKKYRKKRLHGSLCIRIQVTEETYELIKAELDKFIENKEVYRYSRLGVILCLLRIPYKRENKYFCSQFVAEVLSKSGAVKFRDKESLVLPKTFLEDVEYLFARRHFVYNAV